MAIIINKTAFLDAPISVESLHGVVFSKENKGHKFVITGIRGGELQTFAGSVIARFILSNNTTILMGEGAEGELAACATIEDGKVAVSLARDCYNVPGRFQLTVFVTNEGETSCVYAAVGTVQRSENGTLIDDGVALPSVDELQSMLDEIQQYETNIATAGAAQIAAVQAKGEETLDSIPDDYTALQGEVDDLKGAVNDNIVIASKGMTKPGAKVSADGIVQYATQNKYRYFDIDVATLKQYQMMRLTFKNNTEYHMLMIFALRNASGQSLRTTMWFDIKDGDDLYSKYILALLTTDEIKTISCTYVFSPDTTAGNAITGINELDYGFIFTKIDYAKQTDMASAQSDITTLQGQTATLQSGLTDVQEDLETAQSDLDLITASLKETHVEDHLENTITSNASNTAKWILAMIPENASGVQLKVVIPANSVAAITMQVFEYNSTTGTYDYLKDIAVDTIEAYASVEGNYIATYKPFDTGNKALITYADTSSRGFIRFLSKTGEVSYVYDDLTATSLNPSNFRAVNNVELLRYVKYYTAKQFEAKKNIVYVDINGSADYTSVAEAVNTEPSGTTIIVRPGVYDGSIRAFQKRVNIIGTDREKCIIRSTNGYYANPAMECCCGYLENLTFYSQYIQGESEEIGTESGAYAVHCERLGENENIAMGDSLTFVNCNLISDFCPALGVGSFANWSLNLYNCRLVSNQTADRSVYVGSGGLGALYFHDMNGTRGTATIRVYNCVIQTTVLANTMCPYDLSREGASVICEFINNTIYSAVNGFTDSIWWRGGQGAFGNNFHLSPLSHGNTGNTFNNP